jgi:Ca2+-binding RTX toxin-like protein
MASIVGSDSDNRLRGTSSSDTIRGKNGNDILVLEGTTRF